MNAIVFFTILILAGLLIAIAGVWFQTAVFNLWLQALLSGAPVDLAWLIAAQFRRAPARQIVFERIRARQAGVDLPPEALEAHALAGGNIQRVVEALIVARNAGVELGWDEVCRTDLAGEDPSAAAQSRAEPRSAGG